MTKRKSGPALFDLITKEGADSAEALKVPGWWGRGRGKRAAEAPDRAISHGKREEAPLRAEKPIQVRPDPVRFLELQGDRFRVSFTSVTAALGIFVALVVVLGAFEVGRRIHDQTAYRQGFDAGREWYAAEALTEVETAQRQPPALGVIEDLLADGGTVAGPAETLSGQEATAGAVPPWIRNYTYIVAQEFSAGLEEDARKAQRHLAQSGIGSKLVKFASGRLQLITTQGYDRSDPPQRRLADELLKKLHTLGSEYFAGGGGYKLEGYFKTLKSDSW